MRPNWFIAWPVTLSQPELDQLLGTPPRQVRPFVADDLHITLAFLGGVDPAVALDAWRLATADPPLTVTATFGAVEPFGNPRRPSALALTLQTGRAELVAFMAQRADHILAAAGRPAERRSPRPHCTIARPHRKATDATRNEAVAWAAALTPPSRPIALDRLALYTWSEDRRERQFQIVESVALSP